MLACLSVRLRDLFVPKMHGTAAYDLSNIENEPCHTVRGAGNRVLKNVPDPIIAWAWTVVGDTHTHTHTHTL